MPSLENHLRTDGQPRPDFTSITAQQQVEELVAKGVPKPIYLVPLGFGGPWDPRNRVFVPAGGSKARAQMDNQIAAQVQDGRLLLRHVNIDCRGACLFPTAMHLDFEGRSTITQDPAIRGEGLPPLP